MRFLRIAALASAAVVGAGLATPTPTVAAVSAVSVTPLAQYGMPVGQGHAGLYGWGVTTMLNGDVLVGDYWNFRVQRFAADGRLIDANFIAKRGFGTGQHQAPYGLATDPTNGDILMADTDRYQINRYSSAGVWKSSFGTKGEGTGRFEYPSRVAVSSDGYVFVADTWSNRITKHSPSGAELKEFGSFGTGNGQFKQPHGMSFDSQDRLFVTDPGNKRVDVFDKNGIWLFEFGGGKGTATGQFAGDLRGLAVDKANNWVYVVDGEGNRVHKFTTSGTFLTRWGSNGEGPGQFHDGGREVTVAKDGTVWVGDMPNFRVQRFTPQGGFLGAYPNPAQPPPRGGFNIPRGVAVDNAGNMFVSDTYNWRIQKLDPAGNWIYDWGRRGRGDFEFNYTRMIATDPRNNDVVVADTDNHTIKKYSSDGKTLRWKIGGLGRNPGQFRNPHGVDVGADGRVYVADTRNGRVQILSADGRPERAFGSEGTGTGQFKFPRGIAVDASGDIYVSDSARGLIQRFSNTGAYENKIGTSGTADNQLDQPFDVETTSDLVIVADTAANKIKVWRKDGSFVGAYGSRGKSLGQMIKPQGLDMRGNILYICDSENERILKWQLNIS